MGKYRMLIDHLKKQHIFKAFSAVFAAVIIVCSLAGCGEIRLARPMSDSVLLTINSQPCSVAEAIYRLMEVKEYYKADEDDMFWDRSIGDTTFEGYIKDSVKEEMMHLTASEIMSEEMALYLTDDDISGYTQKAQESYLALSQRYDLTSYGITQSTVTELYRKQALYDKVFNKLSENINIQISESDTKVIEINYVEIPLGVSLNTAEKLRTEVKSGTSFKTACESFGWEPVMDQVIMKGDMPAAFENVAYALIDGELSEIIETPECLYIIQCVEDYMISESVANNNKVISSARKARFDDAFNELASRTLLRFNDAVWDDIRVARLK